MNIRLELSTTNLLIGFNVLMFFVATFFGILFGNYLDSLDFLGADVYQFILHGEVWRLLTSAFLHANIFHLLVNMYELFALGSFYERTFGGRSMFSLYVFAGVGGSIMSTLISLVGVVIGLKDPDIYTLGVGASGALFGILGFFIISKKITAKELTFGQGKISSLLKTIVFWIPKKKKMAEKISQKHSQTNIPLPKALSSSKKFIISQKF